jgi:poly-beta-1,6-N-acetyl-D-glucosamine synthase
MAQFKIAAIIPAHNEEEVIAKTLKALGTQLDMSHVYVVDDGSADHTADVARRYTENVFTISNRGKAGALNSAIHSLHLHHVYRYILFMDADTQPSSQFIKNAMRHFEKDSKKEIACVVGRIQSLGGTWVAKYRLWEYTLAHSIHKRAQAHLESILVVPGCATVYRSEIFSNLKIPTGTLTEDMDFTFLLHRSGFSKMIYEPKAVVYTQDPQNLKDFIKQITRWYVGFWQAVKKHQLPWNGHNLDYEVIILATEGLFNGFICLTLFAALPLLWKNGAIHILFAPAALDFFVFFIPTLLWASIKTKKYTLPLYIFHFYFIRFLTSFVFLFSFFKAHVSKEKIYKWDTNRYSIEI